jgi:hypothetical protein
MKKPFPVPRLIFASGGGEDDSPMVKSAWWNRERFCTRKPELMVGITAHALLCQPSI